MNNNNVVNKTPFTECSSCPLYNQKFCGTEHNIKKGGISKEIDLLILGEAPSHEEIKEGRPLVGRAGKVFRNVFEEYNLSRFKYIISNVVLCSNIIDGKTVTPPDGAFVCCSGSWKFLINRYKPKLVILLGSSVCRSVGISSDLYISSIRGKFIRLENYPDSVFLPTFHPSYILRNGSGFDDGVGKLFKDDFASANDYLSGNKNFSILEDLRSLSNKLSSIHQRLVGKNVVRGKSDIVVRDGLCYYKLTDKYYSDEYFLLDCQRINKTDVLYIFKKMDGEKLYFIDTNSDTYFYVKKGVKLENCKFIEDATNLEYMIINKNSIDGYVEDKGNDVGYYEMDVKDVYKRVVDYWLMRDSKPENIKIKKLFFDIEIFNEGKKDFPEPKDAFMKISSITYKVDDGDIVVLLNKGCSATNGFFWDDIKNNLDLENVVLELFNSEEEMIFSFVSRLMEILPDVITGWNVIEFDLQYLINRMKRLGMDPNLLSPFGFVSVFYSGLEKEMNAIITGFCILDMMKLHKVYSEVSEESYSLNSISEKYLGEKKVEYEGTLDDLFLKNGRLFLDYAIRDVYLLYKLDKYFEYVYLNFELSNISNSTWSNFSNTMKLVDSICLTYIKRDGKVCRNANKNVGLYVDERILGAYVLHPIKGRHEYVIDLDFSSMYPSIIRVFNIGPNTYIGKISENIALRILYTGEYKDDDVIEFVENVYGREDTRVEVKEMTIKEFMDFIKEKNYILSSYGTVFKSQSEEVSYFSIICRDLMKRRQDYNSLISKLKTDGNEEEVRRYEIVQLSYKILNNSLYGVLSNKYFRFYDLDLAQTITFVGRILNMYCGYYVNEYLKGNKISSEKEVDGSFLNTYRYVDESSELGMRSSNFLEYIIYQDTDSIFCDLGKYFNNVPNRNCESENKT